MGQEGPVGPWESQPKQHVAILSGPCWTPMWVEKIQDDMLVDHMATGLTWTPSGLLMATWEVELDEHPNFFTPREMNEDWD